MRGLRETTHITLMAIEKLISGISVTCSTLAGVNTVWQGTGQLVLLRTLGSTLNGF